MKKSERNPKEEGSERGAYSRFVRISELMRHSDLETAEVSNGGQLAFGR